METAGKLAGFAVCAALVALILRRLRPEAGWGVSLGAGAIVLLAALPALSALVRGIASLSAMSGLDDSFMQQLLKIAGLSLLLDFAAQTCPGRAGGSPCAESGVRRAGAAALQRIARLAGAVVAACVLAAVLTAGASAESGESESLSSGISTIVSALDSAALESALSDDDPFAQTGGFRQTLAAIARGEMTIDFQQTADLLSRQFFSAVRQSLWRLTRLIAPALLWALLKQFSGRSSECGRIVVQLFVCVFLTQDLSDHITLAVATVQQISAGMQGLLPMLLTMMAAVGGSAGSALMQPAVVASASAMTSLISGITVPLAVASGVLCMLCHLGDGIRVQRLAEFTQQCAVWSLGIGFTVFIGVLTTRSVTAAAIDGVTLRTAKYALNNLVPFVGGLFADTVDTLVGSGMLVQSALGVTGLIVIASRAVLPLCQTLAAAMLYKLASALMQPVSDGSLAGCIHDFAKVLMLLFVLQLSAAAMYLMLIAQLIAVSGFTMMLR